MCKDICPRKAICYEIDQEGFWYPKVDRSICVKCGLCVKSCPNLFPIRKRTTQPKIFAAWSKDPQVRLDSTSGGMFYELAREILSKGGYVVGCVYNSDFKGARHVIIDSLDALGPLMVSKYVQSDTENIYEKVLEKLNTGKVVLFVGAPCHCAAMVAFLKKEYENLILCDFICRGANSPKAHRRYVEYLEQSYGAKMIALRSKDKRNGWTRFGQSAIFENGKEYYASREKDLRIIAYHYGNLMMRESCNNCRFKHIPRDGADVTLADFWGIPANEVDDMEKGISLVMVNTKKGEKILDAIDARICRIEKDLEDTLKGNTAIFSSAAKGKNRDQFLAELDKLPFDQLVKKYREHAPGVINRGIKMSKRVVRKLFERKKEKE